MEMIWSVFKQMRFAFAWVCCDNSNLAWFGFSPPCMHVYYLLNWGRYSGYSVKQHDLWRRLDGNYLISTLLSDSEWHPLLMSACRRLNITPRRCSSIQQTGPGKASGQTLWQVTNAITREWTSPCAVYLSPPLPTPTPPLICVKGEKKNNCSMV